jgi:hypothetical protein
LDRSCGTVAANPATSAHEGTQVMAASKKMLMLATAVGGVMAARKAKARKEEQQLWAEATSPSPTATTTSTPTTLQTS